MKKTGGQILWECLLKQGVHTVFGYPGGAILPAYDAMGTTPAARASSATPRAPR